MKLLTIEEQLNEALSFSLNENELPPEFEGMYFKNGGRIHQVKKNGNRYYYYNRMSARWFPLKKDSVEYTDLSWDDLVKK